LLKYQRTAISSIFLCLLLVTPITGQDLTSTWDAIYLADQAARGAGLYETSCAECHGPELEGGETAPALAGPDFRWAWNGRSVGELFESIRISMPEGRPQSMTRTEKASVLAFMLSENGFPAGAAELANETDLLETFRIDAVRP
jgi:mono/diheme cytochrome c family protein